MNAPQPTNCTYEPPQQPKPRKWPWIVGGVVAVLFTASMCGEFEQGVKQDYDSAAAPTSVPVYTYSAADVPPATAPPAPQDERVGPEAPTRDSGTDESAPSVTLPEVKGRNGGVVNAELQKLGLTNIELVSRDKADKFVVLPANWTAVRIEPAAGTKVKTSDTVVVTMTKQ